MQIDLPTAKRRLRPIHDDLVEAHQTTLDKWRKLGDEYPAWVLAFDAAERAQQLHAHIKLEVATVAESWGRRVRVSEALDFFALCVGRDILLRFKFLGPSGPSNVQTEHQKLLARQLYDDDMMSALAFDGFTQPPTLLTCGYRLTNDDYLKTLVIRRDKKGEPSWEYPIYGDDGVAVEPLRFRGMPDNGPARVRSARVAAKKNEEGGQAR